MTAFHVPHLIEPTLWARACWVAVAYVTPSERPPVLALVFENRDAATAIFRGWRHALGELDAHDLLRVAIIEGEVANRPAGYSVHLGLNAASAADVARTIGADELELGGADRGVWHRMPNPQSIHLQRFKNGYAIHGRYLLVPATIDTGLEIMPSFGIGKQRLVLRRVCDVGLVGDPDAGLWTR